MKNDNKRLSLNIYVLLMAIFLNFVYVPDAAFAVTKAEFMPEVFRTLGFSVTDDVLSEPVAPDEDISKRLALMLALESMGWGFEVQMYEQLTILPELSELDALTQVAQNISPAVPPQIRDFLDDPLAEEDIKAFAAWIKKCKYQMAWKTHFSWEGTELTLMKQGVGNPNGPANGDLEKGKNEPLYVAMLSIEMSRVPCQIATAIMAGGSRLPLARIAEENYGVIGGINGGYFAGAKPIGTLRRQGHTDNAKFHPYRSAFGWNDAGEFIFIDGKEVGQIEGDSRFDKYTEVLQAGPLLLKDGELSQNHENIHENVMNKRHPRTIVGTDGTRVMWVVVDGRDNMHSVGTTIEETRALCKKLGMTTALNLDGGGSSSLWWRGMTFSLPSNTNDVERPIPYAVLMFEEGHGVRN